MSEEEAEKSTVLLLAEAVERLVASENRVLTMFESLRDRADVNAEESGRRAEAVERNIEFIIQQQAKFGADMEQLRESQARSEQRWERAERMWARTEESVRALLALAQTHEGEINALQEAQARLTASQERTDRQMAETDERINVLVNAVEAIISHRRNGEGGEG